MTPQLFGLQWLSTTYIVLYLFTFVYQDSEITVDNYILLLLASCFISLLISFVNSFLGVPPS